MFFTMYFTRDSLLGFEHAQGLALQQKLHGKPLSAAETSLSYVVTLFLPLLSMQATS